MTDEEFNPFVDATKDESISVKVPCVKSNNGVLFSLTSVVTIEKLGDYYELTFPNNITMSVTEKQYQSKILKYIEII